MKADALLGFHGVVIRAPAPADWRRWSRAIGLPVLRRSSREVVFAAGPELFLAIRNAKGEEPPRLLELHLAVETLPRAKRKMTDPLGGDVVVRRLGGFDLVLREFRRPPSGAWRRRRRRKGS